MRKITILIYALFFLLTVSAQEVDDYRQYKIDDELQQLEPITTDTLLFYRALHSYGDLYEEVTAYRFSFAEYARRGLYFTER